MLIFVVALKGLHCHQKVCPLCDKQVIIASALRQLKINFTCIFKVCPKLPASLCNKGNFGKTLKIRVKLLFLHCPRAQVITYTPRNLSQRCFSLFFFSSILLHGKTWSVLEGFPLEKKKKNKNKNVSPHVRCNFSRV